VEYAQKLLEEIGLEGRRIQMVNVSAAMGGQFAWSAAEFTEEIRRLGPNPLKQKVQGETPPTKAALTEG
jgi:F420-non-reducing hydrogenase iron-sulfur subunit